MNLRWTSAGLAALADAANTGTAQLRLTHLAIGDGQGAGGAGDDGRAALRGERHRAVIKGTAAAAGRIAFRADFSPDADYGITEAGVFGTAGDPPSKAALYLYWTDGGAKAGQAANGTALAIGATVDFQAAAADVAVTVGGKIEFGDPPDNATELKFGLTRYATAAETDGASGARAVTPKGLRAKFGALLARLIGKQATEDAVYQLKGKKDGTLGIEERTQDAATATALAGLRQSVQGNTNEIAGKANSSDLPGNASTSKKGIVELATDAEAKTGTDTARAVTPKALKAAAAKHALAGVPAAGDAEKTYVIKRATSAKGGGLTFVEAVFRRYVTPGVHAFTVPAGVTRLRLLLVGGGGGGGGGTEEGYEEDDEGNNVGDYSAPGSPGSSGGSSSVRQSGATLASAGGGAGGVRGAAEAARAGARGYGAGGTGGLSTTHSNPPATSITGAGGKAGTVVQRTVAVTPGQPLQITVGRGGAGCAGGDIGRFYTPRSQAQDGSSGGSGFVQMVNG